MDVKSVIIPLALNKIEELFENRTNMIVLKGFERNDLSEILSNRPYITFFEEDLALDLEWFLGLYDLQNLMALSEKLKSNKKIVISQWLYALISKNIPVLLENLGKTICLENYQKTKIKLSDSEKQLVLTTKLGTLFSVTSNNELILKDTEGLFPKSVPMYDEPEITEIYNLDQLIEAIKGERVLGLKVTADLKKLLKDEGIKFIEKSENIENTDVIMITDNSHSTKERLFSTSAYLKCNSIPHKIIRFSGLYPSEEVRKLDLHKYLRENFKYEQFRTFEVYSNSKKEKYKISQKELIEFLLSQSLSKKPEDLFFVASTGSGKSLIYTLTATILKKLDDKSLTVVISPLKALMKDQTHNLHRNHNLTGSAYINSELSYEERTSILDKVKEGEVFILYISPETFISTSLETLSSGRTIRLLVVDEAHLVSTWGKTFRVDYGYLGDEIKRFRKKIDFPVFATTATAIWGGELDTIEEISSLLNLRSPRVIFADVKRKNIEIKIEKFDPKEIEENESFTTKKILHTSKKIKDMVLKGEKTLVYCPFVNHTKRIKNIIDAYPEIRDQVRVYTGKTKDDERNKTYTLFKNNTAKVVLATKAFGMGIDIPDIRTVYHHRVPANLFEYIQEIGRAGRDGKKATALTYYHPVDPSDSYKLSRISVPQVWKLKHIMEHIGSLVKASPNGEILLPVDDIKHLLETGNSSSKETLLGRARTAIFLLQKDLEKRVGRPILVRRSEVYKYLYFSAPDDIGTELMDKFQEIYIVSDQIKRNNITGNHQVIMSAGKIYSVDITELWKRKFQQLTLKALVWKFFQYPKDIFGKDIYPVIKVEIDLLKNKETISRIFRSTLEIASKMAESTTKGIVEEEFSNTLKAEIKEVSILSELNDINEKMRSIFINYLIGSYENNRNKLFKSKGTIEEKRIFGIPKRFKQIENAWWSIFDEVTNTDNSKKELYISPRSACAEIYYNVLGVLDILQLATVKYSGGESSIIHLKCLDRNYILQNYRNYHCELLKTIRNRLKREYDIAKSFYETEMSSEERWEFIENYLLRKIH
ncbi:helicase-related protein [Kosmotoga sp. DU53]|uniref:helicase-related protein n=1 Tax=Kosmotoga sp. DU53 TaxID=1310160 RepID=UPI0007C5C136|nr:helicase-related protein [Kosmotoga sp. DU53]